MEIIIHRGTHQIGGCTTEYRTKNTRIFIDFGAELDSENAKPFDIEGVTKGKINCDAVFFTHSYKRINMFLWSALQQTLTGLPEYAQ